MFLRILALIVLVVFHFYIVIANIIAFFILPFIQPWYISVPLCSLILLLCFSSVIDCPLTKFENYLRRKLKLREIKGFLGHYVIWPLKRLYRNRLRKIERNNNV